MWNDLNLCNPYAGTNNYHLTKQRQSQVCLSIGQSPMRVTQARVEFSENVSAKSGCGFVQLCPHKVAPPGGHNIILIIVLINIFIFINILNFNSFAFILFLFYLPPPMWGEFLYFNPFLYLSWFYSLFTVYDKNKKIVNTFIVNFTLF